eukprot:4161891-Lingulodinium_polyedra.AAC.1
MSTMNGEAEPEAAGLGASSSFLDARLMSKPGNFHGEENEFVEWDFVFQAYCYGLNEALGRAMEK